MKGAEKPTLRGGQLPQNSKIKEVLKMTKYYNSNQVHKYGYRPQVKIPTAEESKRIIGKMLEKMEIRVDKIKPAWYNIDTIKTK